MFSRALKADLVVAVVERGQHFSRAHSLAFAHQNPLNDAAHFRADHAALRGNDDGVCLDTQLPRHDNQQEGHQARLPGELEPPAVGCLFELLLPLQQRLPDAQERDVAV